MDNVDERVVESRPAIAREHPQIQTVLELLHQPHVRVSSSYGALRLEARSNSHMLIADSKSCCICLSLIPSKSNPRWIEPR